MALAMSLANTSRYAIAAAAESEAPSNFFTLSCKKKPGEQY
jgi:hypothetical protein